MHRLRPIVLAVAVFSVLTAGCDTTRPAALAKIAEGLGYVNAGEYRGAIESFEESIAINSQIAEAHYYIGLIRLQQFNDAPGALSHLETAIDLEPDDDDIIPDMHYQFGVALETTERYEQARTQYLQVVELQPDHGRALYRIGKMLEADGEIREAIDYYTRSIYADPRFAFAYNALGNIYLRYGRPQEAIEVFQNGIENNPEDEQNRADIARVYMLLDDYDLAIEYLTQAADSPGASLALIFNVGAAYRARWVRDGNEADRDEAIEWLTRARNSCNPSEEQARCNSIAGALRELENPTPPGEEPTTP